MKSSKIYEFNPQVYPTRLWVAKYKDLPFEDIGKSFYALNEHDERVPFNVVYDEPGPNIYAVTYPVSNKQSGWRGCLVYINRRDMPVSTCTHEASHCTDWLFEQLGVVGGTTFENGEARSYYSEWGFNRIYEVKQGKAK